METALIAIKKPENVYPIFFISKKFELANIFPTKSKVKLRMKIQIHIQREKIFKIRFICHYS